MTKPLIYDLDPLSLSVELKRLNQPSFRSKQLMEGLYGKLYSEYSEFANIPSSLRLALDENFLLNPVIPKKIVISRDGFTEKALFELQDGLTIETVLMRYNERNSLCVSTQVGCPMGCIFCATGQMGFSRNLSSGEILGQVIYYMRKLRAEGSSLTNLVYMGMGEPFLNYDATLNSIHMLNDPVGLNFGARRITISTVGIIPKIERFAAENSQVNLAVSLHAPDDSLRTQIVPANRIYPLHALMKVCQDYVDQTHRRISFEYALIAGVNDSLEQASKLVDLLHGMLCHVNLIALNPSKHYPLQGSPREQVGAFLDLLTQRGISATVRLRRGIEINAGCGQLASAEQSV